MTPEKLEQYLERVASLLEPREDETPYETVYLACDVTLDKAGLAGDPIADTDFDDLYDAALDRFLR